ncbi:hypothetical protein PVL29_007727 [Vitis rotundifolia]|uniref:Uncharacterized protein n=1 Tax=Vitis rotundifolia TaxID=103349 RepID=A0AA39A0P0_VITRO|nr:hypothetical protein PVL29_007727 [Vitis rotundifolia]
MGVTLGPKVRNVVLENKYGSPKIGNDGVANATNDVAEDGTACAMAITQAIFTEGCKSVAAGMNEMDLRRGASTIAFEGYSTQMGSSSRVELHLSHLRVLTARSKVFITSSDSLSSYKLKK